jgi:hypothetical protein
MKGLKQRVWTRPILEKLATEEKWGTVDKHITKLSTPTNLRYAHTIGIIKANENARDFYFTLLQKSKISQRAFAQIRKKVFLRMVAEKSPYAKFRAACTLAEHGAGEYTASTLEILKIYLTNSEPSVRKIAKKYVDKLSK